MKQVLWYVNRLRCMTPEEIRHRAQRALALRAERWGLRGSDNVPPPDPARACRPWIHVATTVDAANCLAAADRIAAGRFDVFALQGVELGSPPRWNRDPRTGVDAPLAFGKLLDYRNPRLVGDIKYLWEINRHLHIVTLAQACALSGDARYSGVIREHLESWFAACPYRMGPNWSSALEAALRLINWSTAWQLLGGASSPLFDAAGGARFRQRWLKSVFQHAQFVHGHFSLFSSANNHLIGEAAGVFIAALAWPCWPHARTWLAKSKAILEREALLQNATDGVNREQAVCYQQFVLDFLLLSLLAGRANGHRFSAAYQSRIEAMLEYLASIMDAGGNVPMFGDSDDGLVVGLARGLEHCRYRSLLATGAILFHRRDFAAKSGGLDDKTRWLIGEGADAAFRQLAGAGAPLPVRRAFPAGGYYILGCDFETGNEIRLIADAGPLGYQSIAAHGHADALAFTLSVGGREFFIDPGTYAYHTQGPWRQYFRGTAAHNTVRVDGADQSRSGGNFMWVRKANAGCSLWRPSAERDIFEGWHDGYARLPDPVMHRRRISLEKRERRVIVEDCLQMSGAHDIELFFHCSERCRVEAVPDGYRVSHGDRAVTLTLPQSANASSRVHFGSVSPILGWVSRKFDEKQPAATISWRGRLAEEGILRSEIRC
ncbi:MAG: alginate lyase family protein [Betaproteobacteria bacterium]|nr:alginate lyase family protein [Betaproteobacteria bacterium]